MNRQELLNLAEDYYHIDDQTERRLEKYFKTTGKDRIIELSRAVVALTNSQLPFGEVFSQKEAIEILAGSYENGMYRFMGEYHHGMFFGKMEAEELPSQKLKNVLKNGTKR